MATYRITQQGVKKTTWHFPWISEPLMFFAAFCLMAVNGPMRVVLGKSECGVRLCRCCHDHGATSAFCSTATVWRWTVIFSLQRTKSPATKERGDKEIAWLFLEVRREAKASGRTLISGPTRFSTGLLRRFGFRPWCGCIYRWHGGLTRASV